MRGVLFNVIKQIKTNNRKKEVQLVLPYTRFNLNRHSNILSILNMELKEAKGINKYLGLMFRRNPKPLVFNFDKPTNQSIHSYFCKPFIAIWYFNNQLVKKELIRPFRSNIKPDSPFNKLIEIPIKENNIALIKNQFS